MKDTAKTATRRAKGKTGAAFSDDEKAIMQEVARERKAAARRGSGPEADAEAEREVLARIAQMPEGDRILAERVHALVKAAAPDLKSRLWYGMPAYTRDGKVLCHFQDAAKFKARYATIGFSDKARLDDGNMWPTSFALKELTPADEERIAALVKKAVG